MLASRTRRRSAAHRVAAVGAIAAATVLGGGLAAGGAHAAPAASLALPTTAESGASFPVAGRCPATPQGAAVVTFVDTESQATLRELTVPTEASTGAFSTTTSLTSEELALVTVQLSCLDYAEGSLAMSATSMVLTPQGFGGSEIEVGLSAARVAVGGSLQVDATCPQGSTDALVSAGNDSAADPFFDTDVPVGPTGAVSVTVPITAQHDVAPKPGPASVAVFCGGAGDQPTAFGFSQFRIVGDPASGAGAGSSGGAAGSGGAGSGSGVVASVHAVGHTAALANTGTDVTLAVIIGSGLLLLGTAAMTLARRRPTLQAQIGE